MIVFLIFNVVLNVPVMMRGFQKYGVVMKAADVLKLEALEKDKP